jgi:hypothetical protein
MFFVIFAFLLTPKNLPKKTLKSRDNMRETITLIYPQYTTCISTV